MSVFAVVLDAAAFDILDSPRSTGMRALLRRAIGRGRRGPLRRGDTRRVLPRGGTHPPSGGCAGASTLAGSVSVLCPKMLTKVRMKFAWLGTLPRS